MQNMTKLDKIWQNLRKNDIYAWFKKKILKKAKYDRWNIWLNMQIYRIYDKILENMTKYDKIWQICIT